MSNKTIQADINTTIKITYSSKLDNNSYTSPLVVLSILREASLFMAQGGGRYPGKEFISCRE